ncbi:MAG: hypothetical protein J6A05_00715, partial [Oscillospiraceae bacterium]|nr:hypothetical protein [Oscillospiraceae bacterium]
MAKNISKIAAIALASATMVSTLAMTVNALDVTDGKATGAIYKAVVTTTLSNGATQTTTTYYTNKTKVPEGATVTTITDITSVTEFKKGTSIYINPDGSITTTDNGTDAYTTASKPSTSTGGTVSNGSVVYTTPGVSYRTPSDTVYKSDSTGMYYPNLSALQSVEGAGATYTSYTASTKYSSTNCYFDPTTGLYSNKGNTTYSYLINGGSSSTSASDSTSIYKVGNYYYPTYSAAYSAANGQSTLITWIKDYTTAPTNFFSEVTGAFYNTYAAALNASNG